MRHFEGIPIREQDPLIRSVGFTVLFLLALAVAGLLLWVVLSSRDRKEQIAFRRLRVRAETDPVAQKRLVRLQRRQKRHRKMMDPKTRIYRNTDATAGVPTVHRYFAVSNV